MNQEVWKEVTKIKSQGSLREDNEVWKKLTKFEKTYLTGTLLHEVVYYLDGCGNEKKINFFHILNIEYMNYE